MIKGGLLALLLCDKGLIGRIVEPKTGTVRQEIRAGRDGLIFTLREYPMVYKGALLARILTEIKKGEQ